MKKLKGKDILNYLETDSYDKIRIVFKIKKEDYKNNVNLNVKSHKGIGTIKCHDALVDLCEWENEIWKYVNVTKLFNITQMDAMENVSLLRFKVEDYVLIITYVYEEVN